MRYTNEELEILKTIDSGNIQKVDFDKEEIIQRAKDTIKYNQTKKQISINVKLSDLEIIKQKAKDVGIPYQNIIQALIHNYNSDKINLSI
jgi:predicted DNA binding CopG/RHH family protein